MKNYEKYAEDMKKLDGVEWCNVIAKPKVLKPFGRFCNNTSCVLCIILTTLWLIEEYEEPKEPEVDWSKVAVDTPILVRDSEHDEWHKYHFAKYEDGVVYTWVGGSTSWTSKGNKFYWKYAKLAESEDAE